MEEHSMFHRQAGCHWETWEQLSHDAGASRGDAIASFQTRFSIESSLFSQLLQRLQACLPCFLTGVHAWDRHICYIWGGRAAFFSSHWYGTAAIKDIFPPPSSVSAVYLSCQSPWCMPFLRRHMLYRSLYRISLIRDTLQISPSTPL